MKKRSTTVDAKCLHLIGVNVNGQVKTIRFNETLILKATQKSTTEK